MDLVQGSIILEKIPNEETEKKVIQFLSQYAKNLSPEKLKLAFKNLPVTIIKNISENEGRIIENRLKELGGVASFQVPEIEEEPEESFARDQERYGSQASQAPLVSKASELSNIPAPFPEVNYNKKVINDSTFTYIVRKFAEVNKEIWIILSMLAIVLAMNYLLSDQRMLLGLYTLPTLISAYAFGRRHATLTAFASIFAVGLVTYLKPELFSESTSTASLMVNKRWYDIVAWGGILVVTAYAMGTLYERNLNRIQELQETYQGLIVILRQFISNDQYTESHCYRVSIYAAKIASYMRFSVDQIDDVRSAAILHDLGKLEISRDLLHKAARLTDEEFQKIKGHVEKSTKMPKPVEGPLTRIIPIILSHHEHYDGSGYHASQGKNIPIEGRVLAVADAYDSLISDRPYRKAMSPYEVKEIIENGAGTDFDPRVVQAFLQAFKNGELEVPNVAV